MMIFFIEMSKIVIIEYGAGNLFSVRVAIEEVARSDGGVYFNKMTFGTPPSI